ncbi:response regulator [Paenibacillus sp. J5C_2022]|uniref:response regulator n=1 Tax=Paenibacillus sp. J5C2022 TaxID=2977129 RepID=UPI0021D12172|nr:response regulator [Paenibacillus sp. J5C2022]MCU6712255.1 response regulator [Paenibacillus sp. J5C2022]
MRAIIVDDEPMTRSGLRRFIKWDELGIEVAGEAEDGIAAYELYLEKRPDIVLCDVRMPRMDGIAFAERIRQIDPECRIIFLSGYNDVDYLKSAIKLQAVDYMLKPIQMTALTELLRQTKETVLSIREERRELHAMRSQFDRSKSELMEHLLRALIADDPEPASHAREKESDLARLHPSFPLTGYYQGISFRFRDESDKLNWQNTVMTAAEEEELPVLASLVDGLGFALAAINGSKGDERIGLWLDRLIRRREKGEPAGIVAGIGEPCYSLNGCGSTHRQSMTALSYQFYRGWGTIIGYNSLLQEQREPRLFDKQAVIKFGELLQSKQLQAAEQWLDTIINELLLHTPADIEGIRKKLFRWYASMTRIYPESMWEFENDRMWASMFVSGELYTIRKFLVQRLSAIGEALDQMNGGDKAVIRDIMSFIQDNYDEDVSVNTIAGHVHLAPTYMCMLFKKEKGLSIHDYITQYRIKQAKRLLEDRKLKLYEVAARVGYQDANYFAKVFRKVTGVVPSQYRDARQDGG